MPAPSSYRRRLLAGSSLVFGMVLHLATAAPDRVIFKNGREVDGLIVRGNAESITIRGVGGDETFDRKLIRRIDDTATTGAYFAAAVQPLPPWNAIVNDLRANEEVRRLRLVSSGRETSGPAAGWPCVRFEMNDAVELRIYGDPENPAGIQLGLRGGRAADRQEQNRLRSFFAGFLIERKQIAALYALKTSGGERTAGNLRLVFGTQRGDATRPNWWMFAWNLDARPDQKSDDPLNIGVHNWQRGFDRDRDGNLRPIPARLDVASRN